MKRIGKDTIQNIGKSEACMVSRNYPPAPRVRTPPFQTAKKSVVAMVRKNERLSVAASCASPAE